MSWQNRISGIRICLYLNSGWAWPPDVEDLPYARVFQPAHLETGPAGTMWRSHKLFASIRWMKWARWDVDVMSNGGMVFTQKMRTQFDHGAYDTYTRTTATKISRMPWTFHTFETENVNSWDFQFCQVSPLQVAEKFTLTLKKVRGVKEFPPTKNPKPLSYFLQVWVHAIGDFSGYPRFT